jgi:hypothetical protein
VGHWDDAGKLPVAGLGGTEQTQNDKKYITSGSEVISGGGGDTDW